MKTDDKFKRFFALFNASACQYVKKGTRFSLKGDKQAELKVTAKLPGFFISDMDNKIHVASVPLFKQNRDGIKHCADHAVFLFHSESESWSLHLFEFKTTIGSRTWEHVCDQFDGAMIRAYAVAGVLRIPEFDGGIYLHCAYKNYKSNPIEVKALPGQSAPKDFLKEPITLRFYPKLAPKNIPIKLNNNGYAEIKLGNPNRHFPVTFRRMAGEYRRSAQQRKKQ